MTDLEKALIQIGRLTIELYEAKKEAEQYRQWWLNTAHKLDELRDKVEKENTDK